MRATTWMLAALVAAVGCRGDERQHAERLNKVQAKPTDEEAPAAEPAEAPAAPRPRAAEEGKMGGRDGLRADKKKLEREVAASSYATAALDSGDQAPEKPAPADESPAAPTRAWFPETFLFLPLVVTDAAGKAEVPVKVPDRLTSWRVLALAHARTGAQGGAVTSFLGTLPVYVDPVVPPFLLAGDRVRLPVQVVNTTEEPATGALRVEVKNGTVTAAPPTLAVPAGGSQVVYVTLAAARPGTLTLSAAFGSADTVVRTVEVRPAGRPVTETRSGTLAAPRTVELVGPAAADPASDRVRLQVYPGALALLRAEIAAAAGRGGVAEDAYALLLTGRAPALLRALGDEPDLDALRTFTLLAGQRVVRHARTLDVATAALLAEAALAHPDRPVLARLGERAVAFLVENQRPDGSFGGEAGWTLQRLLVASAEAVRAVRAADATAAARQRAQNATVRASAVFERHARQVEDGYTAAALLASGAVTGELAATLRTRVLAAVEPRPDGSKVVKVAEGVVRADGVAPSEIEATALAVLALEGQKDAPLADLGAALLGAYAPGWGWGDGRANLVCMQAVAQLFRDPLPPSVRVTLARDGQVVAEGLLDARKAREVMALTAAEAGIGGAHRWEVRAEPAVPGLGFSLAFESWVPWEREEAHGVELTLAAPAARGALRVGRPVDVEVRAAAPAGYPLVIRHALPAGVQPDTGSLDALVNEGTLEGYDTSDGLVELHAAGLEAGATFAARYRVIPTLAGTLHAAASSLTARGETFHVPPGVWTVQ